MRAQGEGETGSDASEAEPLGADFWNGAVVANSWRQQQLAADQSSIHLVGVHHSENYLPPRTKMPHPIRFLYLRKS